MSYTGLRLLVSACGLVSSLFHDQISCLEAKVIAGRKGEEKNYMCHLCGPQPNERAIFSVVRGSSVRDDEQLMLFISSQDVGRSFFLSFLFFF